MIDVRRGTRENINYYYSDINMTGKENTPVSFSEHWHMSAEFILAVKDGCVFGVNEEELSLQSGDVLLIWPAQLHQTITSPKEGHIILQFSPDFLSSSTDLSFSYRELSKLHLIGGTDSPARIFLVQKMKECLEIYLGQAPFSETKMRIKIYEILLYLCETQLKDAEARAVRTGRNHETFLRIQNACNFIKKNCRESISNFSKVFRNVMNCSPMQYRKKHVNPGEDDTAQ